MAETSPLQWIQKIRTEWKIHDLDTFARLLHCTRPDLEAWLASPSTEDDGTVPARCQGAHALIQIRKKLAAAIPEPEEQLKWLFAERKAFDGAKPIDLMGSSAEDLLWVSYYLESISSVPKD